MPVALNPRPWHLATATLEDPPITENPEHSRADAVDLSEFLQAAIEWLPVGVVLVGASGVIVMANHEIDRLLGYSSAELIGQSIDALVPDAARATHADLRYGYLEQPTPRPMGAGQQLFARRKNGSEVPVDVVLTPIRIRDTPFVLASVMDTSERRRDKEALRAADDEHAEFETVVGELGAEFIRLRPDELDRAIEDALARIVRLLDLDRGAFCQVSDDGDLLNTHQWTRPGWPPAPRVSARDHFPWHVSQLQAGELICFDQLEDVPELIDRHNLQRLGTKSGMSVPVTLAGRPWGAVSFAALRSPRRWTQPLTNRLRVVAMIFGNALVRRQGDEDMRHAVASIVSLRNRLQDENSYLRDELKTAVGSPAIVGHSRAWRRLLEQVRQAAANDGPVLLTGETGTGKGLLAARIHELSARAGRPMVRVTCGSISGPGAELDLFSSDRAATGADGRTPSRLELAGGSTLFLNDIADCPLEAQANLMRLLKDRQVLPRGGGPAVNADVRLIAATRKNLEQCVAEGTFREDLYAQLTASTIVVPPLRARQEDIPLLVWRFVDEFSERYGVPIDAIDKTSMAALQEYHWPGNARELRNVVERAMIVTGGPQLDIPTLSAPSTITRPVTLAAAEKAHIAAALAACNWRIVGKDGAATRLGVTPRTLQSRITRLRITRPRQ